MGKFLYNVVFSNYKTKSPTVTVQSDTITKGHRHTKREQNQLDRNKTEPSFHFKALGQDVT